jgi:hydroxymethylglutaryl-CoA reductase (NADPH)
MKDTEQNKMSKILPPRGYKKEDTEKRKKWLEKKTGFHLNEAGPDNPEDFKGIIENHVGYMHLPLAVAGPLLISGTYAKGEYYVPICTLEGT